MTADWQGINQAGERWQPLNYELETPSFPSPYIPG